MMQYPVFLELPFGRHARRKGPVRTTVEHGSAESSWSAVTSG